MKSKKFLIHIIIVVTALFSFGFSHLQINTSLHYHFQQISWLSNLLFFNEHISYAGGPAEYLTLFVSQFFYSNLFGSLIVALSGLLISFFVYKVIELHEKNAGLLYFLIPALQVILLALFCHYKYPFTITFNLLIVAVFLYLSTAIEAKSKLVVPLFTLLPGVLIYYVSDAMFFMVFMLSSLILLFGRIDKKQWIKIAIVLFAAFLIPLIAYNFIFLTSLKSAFIHSTPDVAVMLRYERPFIFYIGLVMIPAVLLIAKFSALSIFQKREIVNEKPDTLKNNVKDKNHAIGKKWIIAVAIEMVILIGVSYVILRKAYEPVNKLKIEIDYSASTENWDKVLELYDTVDSYDRMSNFQCNRALAHQGEMLDKLFNYEQILGSLGLFLDKPFTAEVALPNSDVYFDLGNIDESLRYAFEAQTLVAHSPRVLKRLIINCIILEKWDAAETYLNVLDSNPIEKKWVSKHRVFLTDHQLSSLDKTIITKRKNRSKAEGLLITPRTKLISVLQQNPENKAAFEYLIAFDLMEHNLAWLTEDMKFFEALNYDKLPVVLEEAILLFSSQRRDVDAFKKYMISKTTIDRFRKFAALTSASKGDKKKAKQSTIEYKNTYWYYVLFISPLVTGVTLDTKPVDANY